MKPVIVWVLLVDKRRARILESQGPQTGLVQLPGRYYEAPEPLSCSDDEGRALVGTTRAILRLVRRIVLTLESIELPFWHCHNRCR